VKPGPRPLPDNVRRLRGGDTRPRPELRRPAASTLEPPFALSPRARGWWREEAPRLARLGLLAEPDKIGLALALESASIAVEALMAMRPDGRKNPTVLSVDPEHGRALRKTPAWQVFREASKAWREWCSEFGMTPAARVGLDAGQLVDPGDDDDDGDGLLDA